MSSARWGDDPNLRSLLGDQGAAGFRALFDGYPELVGVLWALRDDDEGRIRDFSFGYGNQAMMRAFRISPDTARRSSSPTSIWMPATGWLRSCATTSA